MTKSLAKQWLNDAEAQNGRPLVPPYVRDEIISIMESFERYVLQHSRRIPMPCTGTVQCTTCGRPIACNGDHNNKQYCSYKCEPEFDRINHGPFEHPVSE